MMCSKCGKVCGIILLILGIIFLLKDLAIWNFWGLNWWTVAFIIAGIAGMGMSCCDDCCTVKKKK